MFRKPDFNFFPGSLGLVSFPRPCSLSGLGPREAHPPLGGAWTLELTVVAVTLGAARAFREDSPRPPSLPAAGGAARRPVPRPCPRPGCVLLEGEVCYGRPAPMGPTCPVSPQASACLHRPVGSSGCDESICQSFACAVPALPPPPTVPAALGRSAVLTLASSGQVCAQHLFFTLMLWGRCAWNLPCLPLEPR